MSLILAARELQRAGVKIAPDVWRAIANHPKPSQGMASAIEGARGDDWKRAQIDLFREQMSRSDRLRLARRRTLEDQWKFVRRYRDREQAYLRRARQGKQVSINSLDQTMMNFERRSVLAAAKVVQGKNRASTFDRKMRALFRASYPRAYRHGKRLAGGRVTMTAQDYKRLDEFRFREHEWLRGFSDDLQGKYLDLPLEQRARRVAWRLGLYAREMRAAAIYGWLAGLPSGAEVRWRLRARAEHCDSCIAQAQKGWMSPDALEWVPGDYKEVDGKYEPECGASCRCILVARNRGRIIGSTEDLKI